MKLSTRSTYGMRALVELALASGHGPVSASFVAKRQHLSVSYLEQLLHRLKRHGIVQSIRGPRGGYLLAKPARNITMAEVVRILESPNGHANGQAMTVNTANGHRKKSKTAAHLGDGQRHAQWITQAVHHCVHERLTQSLGEITLQDVCQEARAIAGEPLEHRYVFHI